MILILALAIGTLFGAGIHLLLERDLIRNIAGLLLISHTGNLFLMLAAQGHGAAPISPIAPGVAIGDPIVQALTVTAIVITFAFIAFVLALVYRVHVQYHSVDRDELDQIDRTPPEGER